MIDTVGCPCPRPQGWPAPANPARTVSRFVTSFLGLSDTSPVGFQSQMFGELSSHHESSKLGGHMWGSRFSLLREKLEVVSSLPDVDRCTGDETEGQIEREEPFLPASVGGEFFLICPYVGATQLVLGLFLRGNCSICGCNFGVSVAKGQFRIYVNVLNWDPVFSVTGDIQYCISFRCTI